MRSCAGERRSLPARQPQDDVAAGTYRYLTLPLRASLSRMTSRVLGFSKQALRLACRSGIPAGLG